MTEKLRNILRRQYRYLKGMNKKAWAWEFIRRNSAYITKSNKHKSRLNKNRNHPDKDDDDVC